MDNLSKEYLLDFYCKRLGLFGQSPETLRWSVNGQKCRYAWLTKTLAPVAGASILDYGCGFGDLFGFLRDLRLGIRYTGMDINPELISVARRKYPKASFLTFDLEETPFDRDRSFDYIVLCGVFNTKVQGATESMKNLLRLLYPHARTALAATALPPAINNRQHDLNYIDPEDLLDFARRELNPSAKILACPSMDDYMLLAQTNQAP